MLVTLSVPSLGQAQWFGLGLQGGTQFSRQLDALRWDMRGQYALDQHGYYVQLSEQFRSRMFLFNGQATNIQDEQWATMQSGVRLSPHFGMSVYASNYFFTNTEVAQNWLLGGIEMRVSEHFHLLPMIGFMNDARSGNNDDGLALMLQTTLPKLEWSNITFTPRAYADYGNIQPRQHNTLRLGTDALYEHEEIQIRSRAFLGLNRRDSYQASSFLNSSITDIIESVQTDTTEIDVLLSMPISRYVRGEFGIYTLTNSRQFVNKSLSSESTDDLFDSELSRQELGFTASAEYEYQGLRSKNGFRYRILNNAIRLINTEDKPDDRVRRRNEIIQNSAFEQSQLELFTETRFQFRREHDLEFRGSVGILRFDTPEINRDDRDEFSTVLALTDRLSLRPDLELRTTLAGEAFHNVYLYSSRSAENNWRRSLRLIPDVIWQPSRSMRVRQLMMVRANYTVFDYQREDQPSNDQSSRELLFQTEVDWRFGNGWWLEAMASRSDLIVGQLFWRSFEETPIDTLITHQYQIKISKEQKGMRFAAGIRYFLKEDYQPLTQLSAIIQQSGQASTITRSGPGRQFTHQIGPVMEIFMPVFNGNELFLEGWVQRQIITNTYYIDVPEDYAAEFKRASKQKRYQLYPNLIMRTRFYF